MAIPSDDSQRIERALAGDRDAFAQLVTQYQDRLFTLLVHLTRCPSEADDVAQDTWVLAWTRLDSFRGQSNFFTWLYRIAFNTAVSRRRRKRPTVSLDGLAEHGLQITGADDSPSQHLEQQETITRVHAAIDRLNEQHRAVILLFEMEQLEYQQIAEILDLPIGTVRSRLHRARQQLRDELTSTDYAPAMHQEARPPG